MLTLPQVAAILGDAAGHAVAYEELTPAAFLAELEAAGLPTVLAAHRVRTGMTVGAFTSLVLALAAGSRGGGAG